MTSKFKLSENDYQYLFDRATDAMWVHSLDGKIMIANKACEKVFGYALEELIGMYVSKFLSKKYLTKARGIKRKLQAGEMVAQPYEQRLIRRDGTTGILKISTALFVSHGKLMGMQNIAKDVTEEKRLQRNLHSAESVNQTQRLNVLGKIAASVAHEINNPLAGLVVYNKLLSEQINKNLANREDELAVIGKDMLDKLQKMDSAVIQCSLIARELLDFARESKPAAAPVTIRRIVDRALALVGNQAKLSNVEVIREDEPFLPAVMADLQQLEQVMVNLLMNAIQAMPRGGKLIIRTYRDDRWIGVSIQDTGSGITSNNIERLFTPFFTTKTKGTGLGLAISYGIIERHGGKIEVKSRVGKGSTFIVLLPLVDTPNAKWNELY